MNFKFLFRTAHFHQLTKYENNKKNTENDKKKFFLFYFNTYACSDNNNRINDMRKSVVNSLSLKTIEQISSSLFIFFSECFRFVDLLFFFHSKVKNTTNFAFSLNGKTILFFFVFLFRFCLRSPQSHFGFVSLVVHFQLSSNSLITGHKLILLSN